MSESKHIIRDSSGKAIFECYSIDQIGLSYIKIPKSINMDLMCKGIKLLFKGPDYTIGKPKLIIEGDLWIIQFHLCKRPFIRTSLSIEWLQHNVSFEFDDDEEYENWINQKHRSNQMNVRPCDDDYRDYIYIAEGPVRFLDIKDYFRMCNGGYQMLDNDGEALLSVCYDESDENDKVAYVEICEEKNEKLINGDYHIDIIGPVPKLQRPKLCGTTDDCYILEMPDRYPKIMSTLPYNFVMSNVSIHWQPDSFKKIEEWIENGWLVDVNEMFNHTFPNPNYKSK